MGTLRKGPRPPNEAGGRGCSRRFDGGSRSANRGPEAAFSLRPRAERPVREAAQSRPWAAFRLHLGAAGSPGGLLIEIGECNGLQLFALINVFYAPCLSHHLFADTSTSSWQLKRSHQKESQEVRFPEGGGERGTGQGGGGGGTAFRLQGPGLERKELGSGRGMGRTGEVTTHPGSHCILESSVSPPSTFHL